MQQFLTYSFLFLILSSCSRQTSLVPLSDNTEYIHSRLTAIESNQNLQLKINFERKTRNHLIYHVSIDNLSNAPLDILPTDFYYTTSNSSTKFRAVEYHHLIQDIDKNIAHGHNTNEVIGYLQLAHALEDLVTTITDSDKDLSKEAKLQKDLDREQEYNSYVVQENSNSEEIIKLYQLKEQLNQFYLTPATLDVGQSYSGIIYFPRAKNRIKDGCHITYSSSNGKISIPFGQKK